MCQSRYRSAQGFGEVRADQRGGFGEDHVNQWRGIGKVHTNQCDEFGDGDAERCDGVSEICEISGDPSGGFSQNLKSAVHKSVGPADFRPQQCQEETGGSKNTSRRNRFFALTAIESVDDEEVKAVETVQEVVEVTVDSGAAKSVWPSRKKGVERTKSKKAVELAAANGSPIRVEGDARLEFIRDGMKSMKFVGADVKRPLASVGAIVDKGNGVVFGLHESFIENVSTGQRIPMCRRNGVFVMRLDTQPCQKTTKSVRFNEEGVTRKMSGFTRLA